MERCRPRGWWYTRGIDAEELCEAGKAQAGLAGTRNVRTGIAVRRGGRLLSQARCGGQAGLSECRTHELTRSLRYSRVRRRRILGRRRTPSSSYPLPTCSYYALEEGARSPTCQAAQAGLVQQSQLGSGDRQRRLFRSLRLGYPSRSRPPQQSPDPADGERRQGAGAGEG